MNSTSTLEGCVLELQSLLDDCRPGLVPDPEPIVAGLANCWDSLTGDDEGMTAWKLDRAEDLAWQPPALSFLIERHGGTVMGSVWAEVQRWRVDLDSGTAHCQRDYGKRLVGIRQPRLNVIPLAEEVVGKVVAREDDPRLHWLDGKSRVCVLVGKIIPERSCCRETLTARRKRLRSALLEKMTAAGWFLDAWPHTYRCDMLAEAEAVA
jgi:hypothetical protein